MNPSIKRIWWVCALSMGAALVIWNTGFSSRKEEVAQKASGHLESAMRSFPRTEKVVPRLEWEADLHAMFSNLENNRSKSGGDFENKSVTNLLRRIDEKSIPGAIRFLNDLPESELAASLGIALLRKLAKTDFAAAGDLALSAKGTLRERWFVNVTAFAAQRDFEKVVTWLQQLDAEPLKWPALRNVGYDAVRARPSRVIEVAAKIPDEAGRQDLMLNAAARWAEQSPSDASQWVSQFHDPAMHDKLVGVIAGRWGVQDPVAAANFALDAMAAGDAQDVTLVSIATQWSRRQPRDAANWVSQFPEGPLQTAGVGCVVKTWASRDPKATGEWIQGLPTGDLQDLAVSAFCEEIAPRSSERAIEWAQAITDPDRRARQIATLQSWSGGSP
jgi:hypothetical protein